ncbi:MAG TPA: response regulator transcription factor [Streptosporangiaceae bacterium]|jgi:DNA-binding NarL/FixJ family response regulator
MTETPANTGRDDAAAIRIMVVDDNPVVRSGLIALLELGDDIEIVGEAGDGRRAVELAERLRPDIVLLDVRMPLVDGVEASGQLSRLTRVLMLTYTEDADVVRSAIRNGASGYLVHGTFDTDELLKAIRDTVGGTANPLSAVAVSAVLDGVRSAPPPGTTTGPPDLMLLRAKYALSAREAEIMERIAKGQTNTAIAETLFLSEKTVKNHINRIYAKLAVSSRAAAISVWLGTAEGDDGLPVTR